MFNLFRYHGFSTTTVSPGAQVRKAAIVRDKAALAAAKWAILLEGVLERIH